MTFGKAIKEQRIKKGLTQAQLAEMLGKAESTVRTWELDRSSPDRKALYAMCEIFGLTPDYFFYNTTPPEGMDGSLKHSFEVKNGLRTKPKNACRCWNSVKTCPKMN